MDIYFTKKPWPNNKTQKHYSLQMQIMYANVFSHSSGKNIRKLLWLQHLNNNTLFPQKNQGVTNSMGAGKKITTLRYWMKWKPYKNGFKIFKYYYFILKKSKEAPMLMKPISNSNQSLHLSEVVCFTFPTLHHNLPHSQNHGTHSRFFSLILKGTKIQNSTHTGSRSQVLQKSNYGL